MSRLSPVSFRDHYKEDFYMHPDTSLLYVEHSFPGAGINPELVNFSYEGCKCDGFSSCLDCHSSSYDKDGCLKPDVLLGVAEPIIECNDSCTCGSFCLNSATQKGPLDCLEICAFEGKGYGVVANICLPKGAYVCEYAGEVIAVNTAKERLKLQPVSASNYILVMREHFSGLEPQCTVIDPTAAGNIGRYVNHSCSPNLKVLPVRSKCLLPMAALFTLRDTKAGEELCYSYGDAPTEDQINKCDSFVEKSQSCKTLQLTGTKVCLCKSENCRKFLLHDPSLFL